ncbi:hypothetical protein A2379_02895 [Candidatus Amesbacteria bacterium RIFOXYB1_FULL_47_13]|nr:MAG: hypothetical protein A2379_02895 [Candidatus Amesbacteria bacterium RIFOXYB1_FULL_47_13]HBC72396.1 hypothetical protein [Candidatus Amesbacteria bacterium]
MSEKIIGYSLLSLGLLLILAAVLSVYLVFTAKTKPARVFNQTGITLNLNQLLGPQVLPNTGTENPPVELISASALNDISNLTLHLLLMGFVAGGGYRIASLGVLLLRPIEVDLKTKSSPVIAKS